MDYNGWGIHLWGDVMESTEWEVPMPPSGEDNFGIFWSITPSNDSSEIQFMVHKGEEKVKMKNPCLGALFIPIFRIAKVAFDARRYLKYGLSKETRRLLQKNQIPQDFQR